jgi:hypothetical protein
LELAIPGQLLTIAAAVSNCHDSSDGFVPAVENGPDLLALFEGARQFGDAVKNITASSSLVRPFLNNFNNHFQLNLRAEPHPCLDALRAQIAAANIEPSIRGVYDHAIKALNEIYIVFSDQSKGSDELDLFNWLAYVMYDFVPLLRDRRQEALAIFWYFCILPERLPKRWWLDGWARSVKLRTFKSLDAEHRSWVKEPSCWP